MDEEHSITTTLKRASRFWAAVRGNPQVVWAIVASVLTATITGTAAVVVFQQTVKTLKENQEKDEAAFAGLSNQISALAQDGPKNTNLKIDGIEYRLRLQEEWRNQVETGAEIKVPRRRK